MIPLVVHRFRLEVDRRGQLVRRCARGEICGFPGCRDFGNPCWLPDDIYSRPSEHFCAAHMYDQGYCVGCGQFWAGIESFDFSRTGLCDNCEWSERLDDDHSDYWEDDFMEGDDLPHMQVMQQGGY